MGRIRVQIKVYDETGRRLETAHAYLPPCVSPEDAVEWVKRECAKLHLFPKSGESPCQESKSQMKI